MNEGVSVRTSKGERRLPRTEVLVMKLVELASKGNLKAMQQLFAYYQQATRDTRDAEAHEATDLTAADELTLAEFRKLIEGEGSSSSDHDHERRAS
jgi:hypothetical protein